MMFNTIKRCFQWLFSTPLEPRNNMSVLLWWETRRLVYNVVVGAVGMASFIVMLLVSNFMARRTGNFEKWDVEFLMVPACAIIANICYTSGWISEIAFRLLIKERNNLYGPIVFAAGLLFSVALVSLPGMMHVLIYFAEAR